MNKAPPAPQPLFDTLEQLKTSMACMPPVVSQYLAAAPARAAEDYRYALEFLYSYRGSPDTFAAYRREVERLLQWSWFVNHTALHQLKRLDIERFVEFCQQPPHHWIGVKTLTRFINQDGLRVANPEWRPFVVKNAHSKQPLDVNGFSLSAKALQAIFSILSSFFTYLTQEEYIESNPVALIRQKSKYLRKQQHKAKIRRLTELQWGYVVETAERMAEREPQRHERTLFIVQALYGMYLRISELAASPRWTPEMGDFHMDMDGNWWFTTVGKGNKERDISVSDEMLGALRRYRCYRGLSPLPAPGENIPLIPKNRGQGAINSTRQVRNIVQICFDRAVERLSREGHEQDAELLKAATVHWLRHTGISDDVKRRPREHVRDDAGHGSSAITDKYIDIEMRARHRSAKSKPIKPF